MHYTFCHWFLAPTYVLAHLCHPQGGRRELAIFNTSNCFFYILKIVNSRRPAWGWHRMCRNICSGKKSVKESVVHLLDWNKINQLYPVHIFTPCSCDSISSFPSISFQVPRVLWPQNFVSSFHFSHVCYLLSPAHFILLDLIALTLHDGHELWSSLCHFLKFCFTSSSLTSKMF
jgi:hypothetical protein